MSDGIGIAVLDDEAARARILAALDAHAAGIGLPFLAENLVVEAREGGAWAGGLAVRFTQGWGFVSLLAVAEAARGRGVGRRLVEEAEALGRARGVAGLWLDTYSFQAPGFYERLGYAVFGRLPDYPPGHARLFLAKRLDGRPLSPGGAP